jgi:hypothetical protein
MRRRTIMAFGAAVAALGVSALTVPGADAGTTAASFAGSVHPAGTSSICQNNLNPADDTLQSVSAQQFVGSSTGIWTKGASLVRIPASTSCTMNYLIVIGRISGSGPVPKVNISVRDDTLSGPHKPTGPNLAPGNMNIPPTSIATPAGYYNITTNLASPVTISAGSADRFVWVIFQAKMNPSIGGKWSWEVAVPDPAFNSDLWRNPGGLQGCGTNWKPVSTACLGSIPGKGLMMEVGT